MYFSIVSEHDLDICEGPPEISSEHHEEEKYEDEVSVREWFSEIGEHGEMFECWNLGVLEGTKVRIMEDLQ